MHVRMIVTYFKGRLTPKEGHVDCPKEQGPYVLEQCFNILCSKQVELDKMLPKELKQRQFDIIVHGEYLQGFDFTYGPETIPDKPGLLKEIDCSMRWVYDKPLFNILQLGIPEDERPLIKV